MAQAEDTELRDLVLEALEKNGSLAKIRALLRANIFLAFEDDCENMKQNVNLDNILKIPEGVLALSIVHEFLEFCNLKNTLFVYMSESRQGTEYRYEGRNILAERLHFLNGNYDSKEPILVTFVKNILKPYQRKYYEQGDARMGDQLDSLAIRNRKDDQNSTYIVQEDSSTSTSNSTSDNSSDEKNKLHLKLPLDNSDTDTSSESVKEKMSSEYIPNLHILSQARSNVDRFNLNQHSTTYNLQKDNILTNENNETVSKNHEFKSCTNSNSSESTSYVDVKSFKPPDQQDVIMPVIVVSDKMENNPGIIYNTTDACSHPGDKTVNIESIPSSTMIASPLSMKNKNEKSVSTKNNVHAADETAKSDTEVTEYSLDFSLSSVSRNKSLLDSQLQLPDQAQASSSLKEQNSPQLSPLQNSQSSQSSVSISDVADLIEYSDRSYILEQKLNRNTEEGDSPSKASNKSKNATSDQNLVPSEDSGDFSESPIPSLSNLSLDGHSD